MRYVYLGLAGLYMACLLFDGGKKFDLEAGTVETCDFSCRGFSGKGIFACCPGSIAEDGGWLYSSNKISLPIA